MNPEEMINSKPELADWDNEAEILEAEDALKEEYGGQLEQIDEQLAAKKATDASRAVGEKALDTAAAAMSEAPNNVPDVNVNASSDMQAGTPGATVREEASQKMFVAHDGTVFGTAEEWKEYEDATGEDAA